MTNCSNKVFNYSMLIVGLALGALLAYGIKSTTLEDLTQHIKPGGGKLVANPPKLKARIYGTVSADDKKPLKDVKISIYDSSGKFTKEAISSENGSYELKDISLSFYCIVCALEYYGSPSELSANLSNGGEVERNIIMNRREPISVIALEACGNNVYLPIVDVQIKIKQSFTLPNGSKVYLDHANAEGITPPSGQFSATLDDGTYSIQAQRNGFNVDRIFPNPIKIINGKLDRGLKRVEVYVIKS